MGGDGFGNDNARTYDKLDVACQKISRQFGSDTQRDEASFRQTKRQRERQTGRRTGKETCRHTDRQTDRRRVSMQCKLCCQVCVENFGNAFKYAMVIFNAKSHARTHTSTHPHTGTHACTACVDFMYKSLLKFSNTSNKLKFNCCCFCCASEHFKLAKLMSYLCADKCCLLQALSQRAGPLNVLRMSLKVKSQKLQK